MGQYLPIVVLMVLTIVFAAVTLAVSRLLNPPSPNEAKVAPYECGVVDQTEPPQRFPVRFYLVAMIFVVFDIEIIFLYPFTTVYSQLGGFGLVAIVEFAGAVVVSFAYLIANGALDWGPARRAARGGVQIGAERTSRSTIRRVGMDGREQQPVTSPGEAA